MLKWALIKTGAKTLFKNTKIGLAVFVIGFVAFLFIKQEWSHRVEVREIENERTNLQKIAFIEATKDSLASIQQAKEMEELRGLYKSQTQYTLKWKQRALNLQVNQEFLEMGRIQVGFESDDECLFLKGYTLTGNETDTAEAHITDIKIKGLKMKEDYMTVGDKVYSVLHPSNNCYEIKEHVSLIPPEYTKRRSGGIPWRWIIPSAVLGYGIHWAVSK